MLEEVELYKGKKLKIDSGLVRTGSEAREFFGQEVRELVDVVKNRELDLELATLNVGILAAQVYQSYELHGFLGKHFIPPKALTMQVHPARSFGYCLAGDFYSAFSEHEDVFDETAHYFWSMFLAETGLAVEKQRKRKNKELITNLSEAFRMWSSRYTDIMTRQTEEVDALGNLLRCCGNN